MRPFIIVLFLSFMGAGVHAQVFKNFDEKLKNKVNRKVEQKVDRNIDKALNKADQKTDEPIDDALNKKKSKEKSDKETAETSNKNKSGDEKANKAKSPSLEVSSNADFEPGNKVLFTEGFEKDAVGDFPAAWNTSGSGEVVTLNVADGKWLSIPPSTISFPEKVTDMPENFTVEFDLILPLNNRAPIIFGFSEAKNPAKDTYKKKVGFKIDGDAIYPDGSTNRRDFDADKFAGQPIHASISVNKTRIRLYINNEKFFDLPRAFEPASLRNSFYFRNIEVIGGAAREPFYVSNLRFAESGTDARSGIVKELMEKGSVSTNDIQFDFNSDKLKQSSFEVINSIGEAMKQDPSLSIKIIGHSDNVGKADYNQQLSSKRAASVKTYLVSQFGIKADRLQTEGKGSAAPIASNDTEEGRAKNRRVEFVKL